MNKRQRKKQRSRVKRMEIRELQAFSREFASFWQKRFAYFAHPRRRWLTKVEWERRKVQFAIDVATERTAIRKKLETHDYTLAGWIPKQTLYKGE